MGNLFITGLGALLICHLTFAAAPSPAHSSLSTHLETGIEAAKLLKSEAAKGKRTARSELIQRADAVRSALQAMSQSLRDLERESKDESAEGHFISLRQHEQRAAAELEALENELSKSNMNYSALKGRASMVLSELKDGQHEHQLELSEIETHPSG